MRGRPKHRLPAIRWGSLDRSLRGTRLSSLGQVALARVLGPATLAAAARFVLEHRPGGMLAERALVLLESPFAAREFLGAFLRAQDEQSRADALAALMRVADGRVVPWLGRFLGHPERNVHVFGIYILRELAYARRISRTSARKVIASARRHPSPEVRAAAVDVAQLLARMNLPLRDVRFLPSRVPKTGGGIIIDWEALARALGTVRGSRADFAESGAGEEREALARILGTQNVRRAVQVVLQRRPGSRVARAVLALLRPETARVALREAARAASSPAARDRVAALLQLLSDAGPRRPRKGRRAVTGGRRRDVRGTRTTSD